MPEPGLERERILAVDLGRARIGLALSDPLGLTAQPLPTLAAGGARANLRAVAEQVARHDARTVVIGLPLLLSGEEGAAARAAREFAERLQRRLPGIDVRLWDERLTTVHAERTMIAGKTRRRQRREKVDALAAVLILQSYLDAQCSPGESSA